MRERLGSRPRRLLVRLVLAVLALLLIGRPALRALAHATVSIKLGKRPQSLARATAPPNSRENGKGRAYVRMARGHWRSEP